MKRKLQRLQKLEKNKGDVIILVVVILLLIFLFISSMLILFNLWTKAANKILYGKEAKKFSKIGIENAIWEIDKDEREYDSFFDIWRKELEGDEIDLNEDGINDSKWFYVKDRKGNIIGRYAVLVEDETGKININRCGNLTSSFNEGHSVSEINIFEKILGKFLSSFIVCFRYGEDGKPGKANFDDDMDCFLDPFDGIDNNGNGLIDETKEGVDEDDEFYFVKPKGDDRPYFSPSEIKIVPGIGKNNYEKVKNHITCFSYDRDLNKYEQDRININTADFETILHLLTSLGYPEKQAVQIALNIIDYRDKNSIPSVKEFDGKTIIGVEDIPYLNEIEAVKEWEMKVLPIGVVYEEKGGQFIEIFNPYLSEKDISGWKILGVANLFSEVWNEVFNNSKEIYDDITNGETIVDNNKIEKIKKLVSPTSITIPKGRKIPPLSFYTIGDRISIAIVIPTEGVPFILFLPIRDPSNAQQYEPILAINPGSLGIISNLLSYFPLLSNLGLDFTIKIYDKNENLLEICEYFVDTPFTTVQKNDPRMREITDWFLGPATPGIFNFYFQPWIGGEFGKANWLVNWPSSFIVKNRNFSTNGELSFIHKMEHWKTINFWKDLQDRKIIDNVTVWKNPKMPVYGRININTSSEIVLECLPLIDEGIARRIVNERPFKDISEILGFYGEENGGDLLNKEITKYGFDIKDNDLDLFIDTEKEKELVFSKIVNLITVRSNVFKIISLGQKVEDKNGNGKIENNEIIGEKKVIIWYDRNKKKIIYKKEL